MQNFSWVTLTEIIFLVSLVQKIFCNIRVYLNNMKLIKIFPSIFFRKKKVNKDKETEVFMAFANEGSRAAVANLILFFC